MLNPTSSMNCPTSENGASPLKRRCHFCCCSTCCCLEWECQKGGRGSCKYCSVVGSVHDGWIFLFYILSPFDLKWHLDTSLNRLLLQVWPLAIFAYFAIVRAPEQVVVTHKDQAPTQELRNFGAFVFPRKVELAELVGWPAQGKTLRRWHRRASIDRVAQRCAAPTCPCKMAQNRDPSKSQTQSGHCRAMRKGREEFGSGTLIPARYPVTRSPCGVLRRLGWAPGRKAPAILARCPEAGHLRAR